MAYQLSAINAAVRADPVAFMEECDRVFQEKVIAAADAIEHNLPRSPVVLLSGPSGSGKTTTALKIEEELRRRGITSRAIALDNYFADRDPHTAPRAPDGRIDLESPALLDWPLLNEHFTVLERHDPIWVPHFDFTRQRRDPDKRERVELEEREVAIFEGIHALNDQITAPHPNATRLYIAAKSDVTDGGQVCFKCTWMRLVRRAVRDHSFRGYSPAKTLENWANVRRGEKLYITPFKHSAHISFDSSLPYEVSVMANYAKPILEAIPAENQRTAEMYQLIQAFDRFLPIDPAQVPGNSLLREFIGGSDYHY